MERKWTFFISSTLEDLREERQAVANQLLKMEEIPIGMEQFGAIDKSSWENIERFIDSADYYILIIAGKYGSTDGSLDGMSFTEREYRYAKSKSIPVIAVLHGDPSSLPGKFYETDAIKRQKLESFRDEVKNARLVAFYRNTAELIGEVSAAVGKAKYRFPRPGWIRHGEDQSKQQAEILKLRSIIDAKNDELEKLTNNLKFQDGNSSDHIDGLSYLNAGTKLSKQTEIPLYSHRNGEKLRHAVSTSWKTIFINLALEIEDSIYPVKVLDDILSKRLVESLESLGYLPNGIVYIDSEFIKDTQFVFESLDLISYRSLAGWSLTRLGRKIYVDWRAEKLMPASKKHPRER